MSEKEPLKTPLDQVETENLEQGFNFGFGISEVPNELTEDALVATKEVAPPEEQKNTDEKLIQVLNIVMPLMYNLRNSADTSDDIHWPGRKKELTKQINRINKITGNLYEQKNKD